VKKLLPVAHDVSGGKAGVPKEAALKETGRRLPWEQPLADAQGSEEQQPTKVDFEEAGQAYQVDSEGHVGANSSRMRAERW